MYANYVSYMERVPGQNGPFASLMRKPQLHDVYAAMDQLEGFVVEAYSCMTNSAPEVMQI